MFENVRHSLINSYLCSSYDDFRIKNIIGLIKVTTKHYSELKNGKFKTNQYCTALHREHLVVLGLAHSLQPFKLLTWLPLEAFTVISDSGLHRTPSSTVEALEALS